MAQGYTKNTIVLPDIVFADSPNLDAFSRLRVSNALTIFSNQFTYDLSPLVFEQFASGGTTIITFDSTNRLAILTFLLANAGDEVYMQSYEYIPYQPGRSQLVFITFNMFPGGLISNDTYRYAGLGDKDNGFYFEWDTSDFRFTILSNTSTGSQFVYQPSWNLDPLNGSGPSGITIDFRLTQILVIDFQALYVGRVRFGFDIDGQIIYAHEFVNANQPGIPTPYIATVNLPIRVGMGCFGSLITDAMYFICCSVASEGGAEDAQKFGYNFSLDGSVLGLGASPTLNYITSIRPASTFNALTTRIKFVLDSIEIINTGNRAAYYQLGIGATIGTPTYTAVNASYSAMEYDTAGTSSANPTLVFDSGHVPSGGGSKNISIAETIQSKYPITLDATGNPRDLGTLFMYGYGIGGATDIYYSIRWKEIR